MKSHTLYLPALLVLAASTARAAEPAKDQDALKPGPDRWISLFDGKTLKGWEVTRFGGEGEVEAKDGTLVLNLGADLTGVHTNRKLPTINYEVELEGMRVDGYDFFVGLTFPVKESPCTLILGGWGGGVCGLSSIDGYDASENETTTYRAFKNGKWHKVRLRVTEKKIEVWLDGEKLIDQDVEGRKLSIRSEVALSKPFGFASWQTTAALRNIRIREIDPAKAGK